MKESVLVLLLMGTGTVLAMQGGSPAGGPPGMRPGIMKAALESCKEDPSQPFCVKLLIPMRLRYLEAEIAELNERVDGLEGKENLLCFLSLFSVNGLDTLGKFSTSFT